MPAASLLLFSELTNYQYFSNKWFQVGNEIANVLISSSSATNFLLFFLSGAKYRTEMDRILQRFKGRCRRRMSRNTPSNRHRSEKSVPQTAAEPTNENKIKNNKKKFDQKELRPIEVCTSPL